MSRTERAVCSIACVAAMLLLWWSFSAPPGWAWPVRIGAVLLVPATFFGVIAAQVMRQTWREEAGLTKDEIKARRLAAQQRVTRDVFPVLSQPALILRLWDKTVELKRATDKPKPDPQDGDRP